MNRNACSEIQFTRKCYPVVLKRRRTREHVCGKKPPTRHFNSFAECRNSTTYVNQGKSSMGQEEQRITGTEAGDMTRIKNCLLDSHLIDVLQKATSLFPFASSCSSISHVPMSSLLHTHICHLKQINKDICGGKGVTGNGKQESIDYFSYIKNLLFSSYSLGAIFIILQLLIRANIPFRDKTLTGRGRLDGQTLCGCCQYR